MLIMITINTVSYIFDDGGGSEGAGYSTNLPIVPLRLSINIPSQR